ncbi:hypothetical protein EVAR_27433_1 [Eumeta japonica]|uniref:Uncharacterized protein n=1 Tax=Eumeta variegata TaxID=151549 RepID=A0A4C1VMT2_EUMVA|nr:hypothetical protein EVAR_27433_1 [Eumeta japonica]
MNQHTRNSTKGRRFSVNSRTRMHLSRNRVSNVPRFAAAPVARGDAAAAGAVMWQSETFALLRDYLSGPDCRGEALKTHKKLTFLNCDTE